MAVNAKARVAQLTGSRSITAAAELSGNLWVFLLLVESAPFGRVGLKFGSRHRRAGLVPAPTETTAIFPVNAVGAGHWPARRRPLAAHLIRHAPRDTFP